MATVLILEDDSAIRSLLAESLRMARFDVFPVASPAEALTLLRSGLAVDVMVLDLMIQGASSTPFLKAVRKLPAYEHTPVILSTGSEPAHGVYPPRELYQILVRKPYRTSALVEAVRELTGPPRRDRTAHQPA